MSPIELNRRDFVGVAAGISAAAGFGACATTEPMDLDQPASYSLTINGDVLTIEADPRTTLLDAVRERIGLSGTKKGCDRGECGACTVHIDGRRQLSCLMLAGMCEGKQITTIEGIASGDTLHPVQIAFIEHDAFQCGFCTSGQIMSAIACIREGHAGSDSDIAEFMSGNICRCAAYPQIRAAVKAAAHGGV